MISIILIMFIILIIMSKRVDIDLDINETESFDPINMDEEVKEVAKVVEDEEYEYTYSHAKPIKNKIRSHSRRGDHGHKGYTKVQTLAYKKAREFKTSHLNEWC